MISILSKNGSQREQKDAPTQIVASAALGVAQLGEPLDIPEQFPLDVVRRVHEIVIERLPPGEFSDSNRGRLHASARQVVNELALNYNSTQRDNLADQVVDEIIGLGPIEPLLREERITDIMINGPKEVFCEVDGVNRRVPFSFRDNAHLMRIIDRFISAVNRRVDESSPIVDARLPDGSRLNVVLPPLSLKGPAVSIRKFGTHKIRGRELVDKKSITQWMLDFLEAAVKARVTIVVSGGTGAGKTTLLNTLCQSIPASERLVTIEDSAELQISVENLVPLETRPPSLEGKSEITQRHLLKNALRMKPNRIIIGECRGGETFDMLQAMNTGHEGSLTTVHANSPRDAISRLESLVLQGDVGISEHAIQLQIAASIQLIVQVVLFSDGSRRITHITEITGTQSNVISMQDIFTFEDKGVDMQGRTHGIFKGCEIVPECMKKIKLYGMEFEPGFFAQRMEV